MKLDLGNYLFPAWLLILLLCFGPMGTASANPQKPPVIPITVVLGNTANELKFEPNYLQLLAGKPHMLQHGNPGQLRHYFSVRDFTDAMWTQKVEAGKVEIKGTKYSCKINCSFLSSLSLIG